MGGDVGRPVLHALVAYLSPAFGVMSEPRVMPLEDAVDYQQFGFMVLVDPADEADLARYEQLQRAGVKRKWFEAGD